MVMVCQIYQVYLITYNVLFAIITNSTSHDIMDRLYRQIWLDRYFALVGPYKS